MSFARHVLTRSCPSLTPDFREELLTTWGLSTDEAHGVNKLIEAWGEEPNNRRGPGERRRELQGRIVSWLRARRAVGAMPMAVLS